MNYIPKSISRNKGVLGLIGWIKKMEYVFQISFCQEECKVRFVACTFSKVALTWLNDHAKDMGISATNTMNWEEKR